MKKKKQEMLIELLETLKNKNRIDCEQNKTNKNLSAGYELKANMYRDFILLLTDEKWLDEMYRLNCEKSVDRPPNEW